jgi:hypothetical protein
MQFFALAATALLAILAAAAPTPSSERPGLVDLTFSDSTGHVFSLQVLANGQPVLFEDPSSFVYMSSNALARISCISEGVDGGSTFTRGSQVSMFLIMTSKSTGNGS